MGRQSSADELINTMPLRDTVAGEALSTLSGSETILQSGAIGMRPLLASVSVLLSSRTLLRLSIEMLGKRSLMRLMKRGSSSSTSLEMFMLCSTLIMMVLSLSVGLERFTAPSMRSTDRMLRRPKS